MPAPPGLSRALAALPILLALSSGPTRAETVDLHDPTPRWIEARFVQSLPGEVATYSAPVHGWLEPGPDREQVTLRVPAHLVETVLFADEGAVPGSFQDFVWIFERRTGHVAEAGLSGILRRPWSFGWMRSSVEVDLTIRLSTLRAGGYRAPRGLAGRRVSEFCRGSEAGCTPVEPRAYDPDGGSVAAVGHADASYGAIGWSSFASIGRALLRELRPEPATTGESEVAERDDPAGPALPRAQGPPVAW